ncbi:DNA-binding transcriptional regulator LsrR (DeoR family) [Microbacterium sp. W4I4]|uniref:sugar-binding transcriptional regulator n=1 Tax=Microbacterium sp. W4I4 TaxID=3042295 RepID=UPI00278649EE|nr:sugar-binding domain-containing protein [Microbacterium sp. W4I4]MDQ0614444.1 DNA-binding transcriptional regulator LsrR (DeoR family) [Microbacterium sp. W4I4]
MTSATESDAVIEAILRRYHLDDATKLEIASEFGISRFKVARLLEDAKRRGLVRIEITPSAADLDRSERLRRALGLRRAVVVSEATGRDPDAVRRAVGRASARLLTELAGRESVVGISASLALIAMGEEIETLGESTVVQLCGVHTNQVAGVGPVELVRDIAAKSSGRSRVFYAPFVMPTAASAHDLRRDPSVRLTMSAYARLDVAAVSVGSWAPGSSGLHDSLSPEESAELADAGAVAEVCGIVVDRDGEPVTSAATERVLGISFDELRRVPEVIAVVPTSGRAAAIRALAAGTLITSLVTSAELADEILAGGPAQADSR